MAMPFSEGSFVLAQAGADFNGDGRTDFVFQDEDGRVRSWFMQNKSAAGSVPLLPERIVNPKWKAVAAADFNQDGHADILWQNANRSLAIWFMDGTNFLRSQWVRNGLAVGAGWKLAAAADFNNDSQIDFLWQHDNGKVAAWLMESGTNYLRSVLLQENLASTGWRIVGVSDFNNDSQNDILWQHEDGRLAVWYLFGTSFLRSAFFSKQPGRGWRVAGIADLNLDGRDDLVWLNEDRVMAVWYMDGSHFIGSTLLRNGTPLPAGWRFVAPK
jgi:hypothetical protein